MDIEGKECILHVSRAVSTVPTLANVETTGEILATNTGNEFTYEEYFKLLQAASVRYDNALKQRGKRMVYAHDLDYDPFLDPSPVYSANLHDMVFDTSGEAYDVDTPVSIIEAHVAEQ